MAKKEKDEPDTYSGSDTNTTTLTVDQVQRMIDAAFVRYDVIHGHMSPGDGEMKLAELADK